jgi:hypothetical protein
MRGVTLLEVLDDTQRVEVVVEATPMTLEAPIECALTGMPKRWMADVVNQRKRLRQIFIQTERGGDGPGDLRDLHGVGQAAAKVIGGAAGKYLRLAREAPESTGLHNAFAIPLKRCTPGTKGRRIDAAQKEIVLISGDRASMEIE